MHYDHTKSATRREVTGSTIVITGASSGFGRGAAIKLASQGANVVLAARRADALESLASEIVEAGGNALPFAVDVSDAQGVERLSQAAIQRFGRYDIWINNVGIGALGFFWDIPLEDHDRVIDVNLKGLVYGAHVALRHFRERGVGTLINMGSIDSEVPLAYQACYASTKAAVLSLGRSLREELRLAKMTDIKVGTIMPWAVDTPWWTHAANYSGHAPRMLAMDDPQIVIDAIARACVEPQEEMPVGWISRASNASHHVFPDLTERMSADIAHREVNKAAPVLPSKGAIHQPMAGTATIDGGIRARMKREDA